MPWPLLPNPPEVKDTQELQRWVENITVAIQGLMRLFYGDEGFEAVVLQGTFAERPTATGSKRFYYATDQDELYYDKGTWVQITADPVTAFTALTDTPSSYTGKAGQEVQVNNSANALLFKPRQSITLGEDGYSTISEALTAISTTETTLVIPATYGEIALGSALSFPANIKLRVENGAYFTLGTYDLTINGSIESGLYRIFNVNSTGDVILAAGMNQYVFPEWFGAKGDGSTNDYGPVSEAIASASGKSPVWFALGKTYMMGARLWLPANTRLTGHGTIKAQDLNLGSAQGFIYGSSGTSNIAIDNIKVDCNSAAQSQHNVIGIYFYDADYIKIRCTKVICDYGGIYLRNNSQELSTFGDVSFNEIDNSAFCGGNGVCITAKDTVVMSNTILMKDLTGVGSGYNSHSGITINAYDASDFSERVAIIGNTIKNGYTGIAGTYPQGITITGNTLTNQKTGSQSQGIYMSYCKALSITGNTIRDCDGSAITVPNSEDSSIVGNAIFNSAAGVNTSQTYGIIAGSATRINIVGNTIYGIGNPNSSSTPMGLYLSNSSDCVVASNRILTIASGSARGLTVYGDNNMVTGNYIDGQSHGIYVISTSDGNVFIGNSITTTGSYAIYDASSGNNYWLNNPIISGAIQLTNPQFVRNWDGKTRIVAKTGNYSVVNPEYDTRFTNNGATAIITFTLPYAGPGKRFHFSRIASYAVRIDPETTNDYIRGGGAGKYLSLDSDNASVTLECDLDHYWTIVASVGTTSFES